MTASRLDILARLEDAGGVGWVGYDRPRILDLMDEAGLTVDIPDFDDDIRPEDVRCPTCDGFVARQKMASIERLDTTDRWFGEWRDRPDGYDQWRTEGQRDWSKGVKPHHDRIIVEARPVPQPTPRAEEWWVEWHDDGKAAWLYIGDRTFARMTDIDMAGADRIIAALNAAVVDDHKGTP